MPIDFTSAYLSSAAELLDLEIASEWRPGVARFFEVATGMAQSIEATGALTGAEAAPVFTPRAVE